MRTIRRTAILIGLTLLLAQAGRATTLLAGYTDLAAWQAAVTQTGLDTFEAVPGVGNASMYSNAAGYTDALGIDFVGSFDTGGNSLELVNASVSQYLNFGSGTSLMSGASSSSHPYIMLYLPAGVTAISLNVMTYMNVWPVTLTASDGTTYTVSTASGQQSFYGFTFSDPITSLKISIPSAPLFTTVLLDNVRIGTACVTSPVPEPGSLMLIGLGLMLIACLRKYRSPDTM